MTNRGLVTASSLSVINSPEVIYFLLTRPDTRRCFQRKKRIEMQRIWTDKTRKDDRIAKYLSIGSGTVYQRHTAECCVYISQASALPKPPPHWQQADVIQLQISLKSTWTISLCSRHATRRLPSLSSTNHKPAYTYALPITTAIQR